MSTWIWIWLIVALVAAIGELTSAGLFLASLSLAALVAAVTTTVLGPELQVVVFCAAALVGIAVFRPIVLSALGWSHTGQISGPVAQTHIVSRRATVTRTVDTAGGQIRIGQGEFWSARSFDPSDTMSVGSTVEVVLVDGLTALVTPVEQPALTVESASEKGS